LVYCRHERTAKIPLTLSPFHGPSVRGLSPPAIDSRMEVSAWTFFIRT
jgi:hypothetical protein